MTALTHAIAGTVLAAVLAAGSCTPATSTTTTEAPATEAPTATGAPDTSTTVAPGSTVGGPPMLARTRLRQLDVQDTPAIRDPYDRDSWMGRGNWAWPDQQGKCDGREATLHRDALPAPALVARADCHVTYGAWAKVYVDGVYTGDPGARTPKGRYAIEIDHRVPLANAHRSGGSWWDASLRVAYSHDPEVLVAVDGDQNGAKGDKGPEEWRPPLRSSWCRYAVQWVAIKTKYRLSVTRRERDALGQMIEECPG